MITSIDKLPALPQINPTLPESPLQKAPTAGNGFADTLKGFVNDVNQMQVTQDTKTLQFATGEIKDVHEVMAAAEEASISLQLLLEIRNKAVDAYKELIRTPV
jgi:flagellar hook-basal body complex protein FliE